MKAWQILALFGVAGLILWAMSRPKSQPTYTTGRQPSTLDNFLGLGTALANLGGKLVANGAERNVVADGDTTASGYTVTVDQKQGFDPNARSIYTEGESFDEYTKGIFGPS